jgi:hypothetical protein
MKMLDPPSSVKSHLYHIPKTGGRSIIAAFGKLIFTDDNDKSFEHSNLSERDVYRAAIGHPLSPLRDLDIPLDQDEGYKCTHIQSRTSLNGTRFLTFGHHPYHAEHADAVYDKNCCSFTVVRDPFARLFSYYKEFIVELRRFKTGEISTFSINELNSLNFHEDPSFNDFITILPDNRKLEQLYYFSREFDIKEAIKNTEKLSAVVICEKMEKGSAIISNHIGLNLQIGHHGARSSEYSPSKEEVNYAKRELEPEYEFYEHLFKENYA